jgi:ABC-type branched-subunit amino acid transport system substrate-binding protein
MKGATLAIQEIKALGGPNFQLSVQDDGTIDTQKGSQLARGYGLGGYPIMLTRGGGVLGSELPAAKQYEMTEFDVNTALTALNGTPYYYTTSAQTVNGPAIGMAKFLQSKGIKSAVFAALTGLGATDKVWLTVGSTAMANAGIKVMGVVNVPLTATDFTAEAQQIIKLNPPAVYSTVVGNGGAVFSKEVRSMGYKGIIIGADYSPVEAKIAGSAWSDYYYGYDFFPYQNPPNPWSKIFLTESERAFNDPQPEKFYASTYDTMFVIWALVRQIVAQGGDPTKQGDAYVKAWNAQPTVPSIWGGDASTDGTSTYSPTTHGLVSRALSIAKANVNSSGIGSPVQVATFDNLTGANFKLVP